jgi:hypothetical protein
MEDGRSKMDRRARLPSSIFNLQETEKAAIPGDRGLMLKVVLQVPRTPSLELYVLPNGGGQSLRGQPKSQKVTPYNKWS